MSISDNIFKIMDDKGISQHELSRQTGIAQSCISDWKTKGTDPQAKKIISICEVLGCSPYDILIINE